MKRTIILIDGSNFYFKLKDLSLNHLLDFDFSGFSKSLVKSNSLVNATYYVGAVRSGKAKKTQELFNSQRKLLSRLKKHGYRYSLGYLMNTKGKVHEKGVDVQIAVDILIAVYEDTTDRIILVSSDTDLLPAVKKAKEKGKHVEYIGFSHRPSLAMIANCSQSRLLTREDIEAFLPNEEKNEKK